LVDERLAGARGHDDQGITSSQGVLNGGLLTGPEAGESEVLVESGL